MKKLLALLMTLTMLLAGCSTGETIPHFEDGASVGSGATAFTLTITDPEGKETQLTIQTDEETVGAALQAEHIVFGTKGEYGLFIDTVNGLTLDYEKDGVYWAFYVGDTYAEKSADLTPIEPGGTYALKAETM